MLLVIRDRGCSGLGGDAAMQLRRVRRSAVAGLHLRRVRCGGTHARGAAALRARVAAPSPRAKFKQRESE